MVHVDSSTESNFWYSLVLCLKGFVHITDGRIFGTYSKKMSVAQSWWCFRKKSPVLDRRVFTRCGALQKLRCLREFFELCLSPISAQPCEEKSILASIGGEGTDIWLSGAIIRVHHPRKVSRHNFSGQCRHDLTLLNLGNGILLTTFVHCPVAAVR